MSLNMIELKDICIISCLVQGTEDKDDLLKFCCHDQAKGVSYSEYLPESQFLQRIKKLNKRVEFPAKIVRSFLSNGQPTEATLHSAVQNGAAVNEDNVLCEHQDDCAVLRLKYRIDGTPAPFKWEWHLKVQDSGILTFYRYLLKHAQHKAACLSQNQQLLLDVIKKKDIELRQYRLDGARHWRTTVATDPFDVEAFNEQNKHLLTSGSYLDSSFSATTAATIKSEVEKSADSRSAAKALSPRNRKRKAMETGNQHVERKVLQRRRMPELQYKSSQGSQESQDLESDVTFEETKGDRHTENETELKQEPKTVEPAHLAADSNYDIDSPEHVLELNEIMQLIERTTAQTRKLLEEHNGN